MKKRTATYSFGIIILVMITLTLSSLYAAGSAAGPKADALPGAAPRADIVTVGRNAEDPYSKREKPEAIFLHDQHTAALAEAGMDCSTCHGLNDKGKFDFVMKDTGGLKGTARKEAFHNACVTCHQERAAQSKSTGPVELSSCGSCHMEPVPYKSNLRQVRMPQAIHSLHTNTKMIPPKDGDKDNCYVCHHSVIDQDGKTLILERGKEQACFSCHLEEKSGNTPKLEVASHQSCLSCHATRAVAGKETGPTNCSVCHAAPLATEKRTDNLPRLDRGQPDKLFILPAAAPGEALPNTQMPAALFNHKAHEQVVTNCSTCHHARIDKCSSCHTLSGSEKANFVNLYQATHTQGGMETKRTLKNAESPSIWGPGRTCNSCHLETAAKKLECVGCHSRPSLKASKDGCATCHVAVTGSGYTPVSNQELQNLKKAGLNMLISRAENTRSLRQIKVNLDDIPDVVTVGVLAKEYAPVKLPHRKIVKALLNPVRGDNMAYTFHGGDLRACQACHHNSAASLTPPSCASCHARDAATGRLNERPALQQAYHQQCMNCHDAINLAKPLNTDCQGCHAKR